MRNLLIALIVCVACPVFSQQDVFLHITPKIDQQVLTLQTNYQLLNGQMVNLDHFNYYISDIELYHDGGMTSQVAPAVFLVTPSDYGVYLGNYPIQSLDSLQFLVGVPPRLNTQSGTEAQDISAYPNNHPLSFQSPAMYWGWQFGYMHMIVGGSADSNNDQNPDAYFELHNLGDHNQRYVALQVIPTATTPSQFDVYLECHADYWLNNLPLASVGVLHGEIGLNHTVMANVNSYPVFTLAQTAGVETQKNALFYTSGNTFYGKNLNPGTVEIRDVLGRWVHGFNVESPSQEENLVLSEGIYTIIYLDAGGMQRISKNCLITP
jgi:hypothetical protein